MLAGFSPGRRCSLKRSLKKLFGHENRVNSLTWPAFMLIYRTKESPDLLFKLLGCLLKHNSANQRCADRQPVFFFNTNTG